MNDVRRGQAVLLVIAVVLFAIPSVFGLGPSSTHAVVPDRIEEVPEDEEAVPISAVTPAIREEIRHAVTSGDVVTFATSPPEFPNYVRHDGEVFHLGLNVADSLGRPQLTNLAYLLGAVTIGIGVLLPRIVRLRRGRAE